MAARRGVSSRCVGVLALFRQIAAFFFDLVVFVFVFGATLMDFVY
jgi:hypothetical protein